MSPEEMFGMEARGDTTPQKEAASRARREIEALRREVERWHALAGGGRSLLEALLHHSPHGIIVSDASGRLIVQNRASERIWAGSATADDVQGWGHYRAFHPDGTPFAPGDWSMARCLTRREIVEAEEVHYQRFDGTHGILLGSCAPIFSDDGALEGALSVFADISALKHVEEQLQLITDSLPVLISYIDASLRYQFNSLGYERWFGLSRAELRGMPVRDVQGDAAFATCEPYLRRALSGEALTFRTRILYRLGGPRDVEATYVPHFGPDRSVLGVVTLVSDVSERNRIEQERARWAERTSRLLRITAALADAVTPSQVLEAVVDRAAAVLRASSVSLWLLDDEGRAATLARSCGYTVAQQAAQGRIDLDAAGVSPAGDTLRTGQALWFGSRAELSERYPHLASAASSPRDAAIASLPMSVEGRTIGVMALSFEDATAPAGDDRALLVVVARHCAQALERMRLLREAELAYAETELLYRLTDAVNRAQSVEEVYEASLDTIGSALDVERAAILFFDPDAVMRFKAWRGLSDAYRAAVEGHAPWRPDDQDPQPVWIDDAERDARVAAFAPVLRAEGIRALAFVPLVYESRLLGKFMLYWAQPRALGERERGVARSIADQVASAVGRKRAQQEREALIEQLSQTVRLNELFAGVVGHDLRNPLSAIISAAQLALRREEGERLFKPLSRILSSGERMTRMIEQLLDFTRARAGGGIPVDPRPMDIGALGRQVLDEIEDANPERTLLVEMAGALEGVWDPDRLAQVISNLAANAIQHGAPSAPVRVRFDGREPASVVVVFENEGAVRPEVLPMIFEPFRGPSQRRERAKGLGLGLYITHQIVLAHGGSIDVTSAEGSPTAFTVTLPRRAA